MYSATREKAYKIVKQLHDHRDSLCVKDIENVAGVSLNATVQLGFSHKMATFLLVRVADLMATMGAAYRLYLINPPSDKFQIYPYQNSKNVGISLLNRDADLESMLADIESSLLEAANKAIDSTLGDSFFDE